MFQPYMAIIKFFTMCYMPNCTLMFNVLQYDVNQTLVYEIKYNCNTYDA
jgi:hypothetical protein